MTLSTDLEASLELETLRAALRSCRDRFAEYAQSHARKAAEAERNGIASEVGERSDKVRRNQEMIDLIDRALDSNHDRS